MGGRGKQIGTLTSLIEILEGGRPRSHRMKEKKATAQTETVQKEAAGIQSLETGLSIAFALARASRRLSLTEISAALGILPSTVHRHLVSLTRLGLVQQNEPNGRYELGPGAAEFGFAALRALDAQKLWGEAISRLRDETGLTTLGVVWGTFGPTVIQWKASLSPVTMHVHLGAVLPLLTSASGHVFCAFHAKEETEPLIDQEFASGRKLTFRGAPLTTKYFGEVIQNVRKSELSVVQGDLHAGVDSLSAPVFQSDGSLQLALTVLGSPHEVDLDIQGPHAAKLKSVAGWVSSRLGYAIEPARHIG